MREGCSGVGAGAVSLGAGEGAGSGVTGGAGSVAVCGVLLSRATGLVFQGWATLKAAKRYSASTSPTVRVVILPRTRAGRNSASRNRPTPTSPTIR